MSLNRRHFLHRTGIAAAAAFFSSLALPAWSRNLEKALKNSAGISPEDLATEEEFWHFVRQSFTVSAGMINLNNGGVSPAPRPVQEAMKRYYDYSNEAPSYYMWRILDQGRETLRRSLAEIAGCSMEEIAINRNATEGMATVINGLHLRRGDEVVLAKQDYPNIINAWKQREARDGIILRWISPRLPSVDENYLADQYVKAFTPATKAVNITHMINWNGQVMPVRRIADEARRRGISVVVDGAHSFGQLQFRIPDLGADYFATSLHKWLYAPIGSGMLYISKEKIPSLYPLFGSGDPLQDDIRKFEHLGTRPFFIEQAIGKAVDFHRMIGSERKQRRLHYLKNFWMEKVKSIPGVKLHTSTDPLWGCAIGVVSVEGRTPAELDTFLFDRYRIHAVAINWEDIRGVRITPNVYTTTAELDRLVEAITVFAAD